MKKLNITNLKKMRINNSDYHISRKLMIESLEEAKEILKDVQNHYYDVHEKCLTETEEWLERFEDE